MQKAQERADMRRDRRSRVVVGRQRQKVLDDGKHLLAGHLGKRLSRDMRVVPGENPTGGEEQPFAGLRLETTDVPQVIQIGVEQWPVRIRLRARDREAFGSDPARKLDRRACGDAGCLGRILQRRTPSMTAWSIGVSKQRATNGH